MKSVAVLLLALLFATISHAEQNCRDADGKVIESTKCTEVANSETATTTPSLPAEAMAEVKDLNARMRYFMAIGFHKHSKQKRKEIVAIYEKHEVPLPVEFQEK